LEAPSTGTGPSPSLNLTADLNAPRRLGDFAAKADSIGLGGVKDAEAVSNAGAAAWALGGSNHDVVANRAAIRMANLSAAETLKAEMASLMPVKSRAQPAKPISAPPPPPPQAAPVEFSVVTAADVDMEVPGFGTGDPEALLANAHADATSVNETETSTSASTANEIAPVAGVKRPFESLEDTPANEDFVGENEVEAEAESTSRALDYKVNSDGTVEQVDTVRYVACLYSMYVIFKTFLDFGSLDTRNAITVRNLMSSTQMRSSRKRIVLIYNQRCYTHISSRLTTHYVEGLAWVLAYYYQGVRL
jgi:5'-3' exoribonuclease 2